jgi:antitoxin component of MazEF toxin-antitoxin module
MNDVLNSVDQVPRNNQDMETQSFVEIKDIGNEIIIKPKKKNKLLEMLDAINEQSIHEEVETNGPVGKEISI